MELNRLLPELFRLIVLRCDWPSYQKLLLANKHYRCTITTFFGEDVFWRERITIQTGRPYTGEGAMTLSLVIEAQRNLPVCNCDEVMASINIPSMINFYLATGFGLVDFKLCESVRRITLHAGGRLVDKTIMKDFCSNGHPNAIGVIREDFDTYILPHLAREQREAVAEANGELAGDYRYWRKLGHEAYAAAFASITPEEVVHYASIGSDELISNYHHWDQSSQAEREEILRVATIHYGGPLPDNNFTPPTYAVNYPTLFDHLRRGHSISIIEILRYLGLPSYIRLYVDIHRDSNQAIYDTTIFVLQLIAKKDYKFLRQHSYMMAIIDTEQEDPYARGHATEDDVIALFTADRELGEMLVSTNAAFYTDYVASCVEE